MFIGLGCVSVAVLTEDALEEREGELGRREGGTGDNGGSDIGTSLLLEGVEIGITGVETEVPIGVVEV